MSNYPEVIDYAPLHINAQELHAIIARHGGNEVDETVALAIAGYANPRGEAFPGLVLLARITGYTIQEVSRAVHRLAAWGVLTIRKAKVAGSEHCHNVYKFFRNLVRKTADASSAHFIENVKKWRAEGKDVVQAIKKRARQSLETLTAKAEKRAALFQEKPELLDDPERAPQLAGVADNSSVSDVVLEPVETSQSGTAAPVHTSPIEWEDGETWEDTPAEPPTPSATGKIAALFGIPEPSHCEKTPPATPFTPNPTDEPLPDYYQKQQQRVHASWRDRVAAYQKTSEAA